MSNALRNTFVPKRSPVVQSRILARLTTDSLLNLCLLWCSMPITAPRPLESQLEELGVTHAEYVKEFMDDIKEFKEKRTITKRKVIDRLLVDYYPRGLNLLQYAQIDSQLIVEKQQGFLWQVSKLINTKSQPEVLNLHSPQIFLENLVHNLSKYYMNHIYISTHPHYPLTIIRIQLFDLVASQTPQTAPSISNSLVSRKPFLLALPANSPNIIHSPLSPQDNTGLMILQSISTSLSTPQKQVRIQTGDHGVLKSLESLHIIHGNSRFANMLGVWAPYADGKVDISPFDDVEEHQTLQTLNVDEGDGSDKNWEKIARLRFKGSLDELSSDKLYEDTGPRKKRKVNDELRNIDKNEYSSLTPVQYVEFEIKSDFKAQRPTLKLKLQGNDVFAGLHELCASGLINPETIPGFLTGEEGLQSGSVDDGVFIPKEHDVTSGDLI